MVCVHVQCCALVDIESKTKQTAMKARTWFCCEAIRKEKPNKVKCDADEIEIYIQQDEPLFVPSTSLLVAVVLVTCLLFGFSSFLFECLLRRMATGARKTKKLPLNAVSPSPPLSRTCSYL